MNNLDLNLNYCTHKKTNWTEQNTELYYCFSI